MPDKADSATDIIASQFVLDFSDMVLGQWNPCTITGLMRIQGKHPICSKIFDVESVKSIERMLQKFF